MIEKFTPQTVIITVWVGWLFYTTMFDYRRYRFNTMPYLRPAASSYAREIELGKLGKVYKFKEHLTKSMYKGK